MGKTPGGNADVYEYKGVAGEAIRKIMKTKGRQYRNLEIGLLVGGLLMNRQDGGWTEAAQT
jgi:hypothetical protein